MLNLPNTITLLRIALVVVFTVALSVASGAAWGYPVALLSFCLAAASDWLDGYLARKLKLVTTFGKLIDPLADKILVSAAFVYLTSVGLCPFWATALIICREFLVTGLRQIAQTEGVILAADTTGKWKTGFQLAFCIFCLLQLTLKSHAIAPDYILYLIREPLGTFIYDASFWGAIILTLWSAIRYCFQMKQLLSHSNQN